MLYSYSCNCGKVFDEFTSYEKRNDVKCSCGKRAVKLLSDVNSQVDNNYKDLTGQKIWFPKDGKPYFDVALRRTFNSVKEKQSFMKERKIVMDGSDSPKKWPIESGDVRDRSYRKQMRMED